MERRSMTSALLLARDCIIYSVNVWLVPVECVFDMIESELARRGVSFIRARIAQSTCRLMIDPRSKNDGQDTRGHRAAKLSKKQLLAIIVLSATLATTGAIADVTHTTLDANRGVAAQRDTEEAVVRRLLEQFRTIKIPLSQAVAIAEHLHDGSRTADVGFETSGPATYRVRTVRNERIWENVIDATTGSVTEKEISSSLKELDREDLGNIIALKSVEQALSDAVRIAEKAAAGSALAGGLMRQDGKLNFVVVIASGDRLKEVMLQPPRVGKQRAIPR
jgi:uncharacterized membrane protein YkoI